MKGVVNKPTFDMNVFNPGVAVRVVIKERSGYKLREYNAIITSADPLQLHLMYWDEKKHQRESHVVHIEPVVKELTELTLLVLLAATE
jgi:hypothetical protein